MVQAFVPEHFHRFQKILESRRSQIEILTSDWLWRPECAAIGRSIPGSFGVDIRDSVSGYPGRESVRNRTLPLSSLSCEFWKTRPNTMRIAFVVLVSSLLLLRATRRMRELDSSTPRGETQLADRSSSCSCTIEVHTQSWHEGECGSRGNADYTVRSLNVDRVAMPVRVKNRHASGNHVLAN